MNTDIKYDNKSVLITGGAGFIGSRIALKLQKNYPTCKITIFDYFNSRLNFKNGTNYIALGHYNNIIDFKGKIICGDINNENDLNSLKEIKWDVIFHQAAISDTTVIDQNLVLSTNFNTFNFFVDLATKQNCQLIYASSAGVYGNTLSPNIVGKGEIPENVYGFSKLMMDNYTINSLIQNPSLKIIGLRYFNVYGPGEYYKNRTASMILQMGLDMLNTGSVSLFKFGEQSRDFVYIEDVVDANINAIGKKSGIYNIGSGCSNNYNELAEVLSDSLSLKIKINYIDNPYKFFQQNTQADISETIKNLDYLPKYNLEKGIKDYSITIRNIFNSK